MKQTNSALYIIITLLIIVSVVIFMSITVENNLIDIQSKTQLQTLLDRGQPELNNLSIEDKDMSGLKLKDIVVNNLNVTKSDLSGSHFENVQFVGGSFTSVDFTNSYFENVHFSDVQMKGFGELYVNPNFTRFGGSQFLDVVFENSALNNVLFWDLKELSKLKFLSTKVSTNIPLESILSGSLLKILTIDNSTITGVDLSSVKGNGQLVINKSKLTGVKMTNSLYRNITITDSTLLRGALNAKNVDELTIKDSRLSFRISVDAINAVIANNELMEDANGIFTLHSSTIKNLVIEHCKGLAHAFLGSVNIDKAFLNKCNWGELNMFNGAFKQLVVKNGNIDTLNLKLTKATELEFENVSFLNQIDGRENKIEFLRGKNITFADNMKGDKDGQIFIRKLKNSAR